MSVVYIPAPIEFEKAQNESVSKQITAIQRNAQLSPCERIKAFTAMYFDVATSGPLIPRNITRLMMAIEAEATRDMINARA